MTPFLLRRETSCIMLLISLNSMGGLSGLLVQPAKSQLIFWNQDISQAQYEGIDCSFRRTTKYLSYEVDPAVLENRNWALMIQKKTATSSHCDTGCKKRRISHADSHFHRISSIQFTGRRRSCAINTSSSCGPTRRRNKSVATYRTQGYSSETKIAGVKAWRA